MWLLSTKYNKKETYGQTLVFLKDDGEMEEIYMKEVYPYFYTDLTEEELIAENLLKEQYWDFDKNCWRDDRIVSLERVKRINPMTRETIELTKINTTSPNCISNNKGTGLSQFLPNDFIYNNRNKYTDVFLQETGFFMAMPYKNLGNKVVLDIDTEKIKKHEIYKIEQLKEFDEELFDWFMPLFTTDFPSLKDHILAIDIEVDHNMRMMTEPFKAKYPISSIAFKSSVEEIVFVLDDKVRGIESKEDTWGVAKKMIVCKTEAMLIKKAVAYMTHSPQKIVVGYNVDQFDLPYLFNRAVLFGADDGSFWAFIRQDERISKGVKGKFLIDLFPFFVNPSIKNYAFSGKYDLHSLNEVSEGLIGKSKYKFEGFINSLEKHELSFYNLQDVNLVYSLCVFDDEVIMKLAMMLQRLSGLTFEAIFRRRVSSLVINMLQRYMVIKEMFFPNKQMLESVGEIVSEARIEGKLYEGAKVLETKTGLHFDITVVDFASLYPSIMHKKNLCFSTVNCGHDICKDNTIYKVGHHVCTLKKGLMSEMVGFIKDVRVNYYKYKKDESTLYSVVDQALKVYINASYGVFGNPHLAYYAAPVAESITAEGEKALTYLDEYTEKIGIQSVGGDTDSLFIKTHDDKEIRRLIDYCRDELELELGVDYKMKFMNSYKKKNYYGVTMDNKPIIKGLMGKKRNTPKFVKGCFTNTLEILQTIDELNKEEVKQRVKKEVRKYYLGIKKRTMVKNVDDFAVKVIMKKNVDQYVKSNPLHVRMAKVLYEFILEQSEDKNIGIRTVVPEGSVIMYVYTTPRSKRSLTTAKPIEMATPEEIDTNKYGNWLLKIMSQIYEPLGFDANDIIGINQTKMGDYFD